MSMYHYIVLMSLLLLSWSASTHAQPVTVDSLEGLYAVAARSGQDVRVEPGVYALTDYLTDERMREIAADYPTEGSRPPKWLLRFEGSKNTFDFTGVTIEIDTSLYSHIRHKAYARCIFIDGDDNTLRGLTIRNTGPVDEGTSGNILSVFGDGNTLDGIQLYVRGSRPYGYGDLLGKGGPNLTGLQKQSGIMIAGQDNTLRRCKVFSRAFGHCFYIQTQGHDTNNILLEDCYAEGEVRTTTQMLAESDGPLVDLNYRSVYGNRENRFIVNPGYTKSLTEDGFRTYGGVGKVTLRNCIAVNTRAGFEISGTQSAETQTVLEGCQAFGTERGYLLGSNVLVRDSRGDIAHGPLLYLRENTVNTDVSLELIAGLPETTVHAIATIAGENHKVFLFTREPQNPIPALPIFLGFGMPGHGEMSSGIESKPTSNVALINEIPRVPIIVSDVLEPGNVQSGGVVLTETEVGPTARGAWKAD